MNGIERMLAELVQMAESPLYSAYRWLGKQLGRRVSLGQFLMLVQGLLDRGVVRLWSIEPETHERDELHVIPEGLKQRYAMYGHSDPAFDPFGLSLTAGSQASLEERPEWDVELDFDNRRFSLTARAGREASALEKLAALFPDVELAEVEPSRIDDDRVQLSGLLRVPMRPDRQPE